ncbi:hypothetical protein POSPLADRAFT_1051029 [Postia placenta MAD-698-R-SB12]|uniref:DUF6534 domain-containing protein n=1 Tax=Postia placenta MAD-698-R-SB12 TaxID=670580 RepID=A0A1X6NDZ8_9APHY|nr:hypothetical protein POSPLADRAFT_1051029 [Postia placenta MAD-698-R-SB12]OSX66861.1 hypothetical protein POSPLADRAFT_1051029 [Postia placenta MAD-698-R-SB12]
MPTAHIPPTLGAVLVGSLVSIFLSGTVSMQTVLYTSVYQKDPLRLKIMVYCTWMLDFLHTVFICVADWSYLIAHWDDPNVVDWIPWAVAVTVALTAIMTFVVQCFFAYRVYTVSRHKWHIALPLAIIALARLVAALVSTAMMIRLKSYTAFRHHVGWVFTLGLSLSAALDVLVAASLCYYLRKNRSGFTSMDALINALTFYTVQNGSLTFIATVIALACWVSLRNLVFLALHFIITKLYANALLSTLNARRGLRLQHTSSDFEPSLPVVFTNVEHNGNSETAAVRNRHNPHSESIPMATKVHINVEHTVEIESDTEPDNDASKTTL